MIKIGKNGETEKNPDKADEISKQNSEAGNNTEEKEYLTEEEMFADTPDFWKESEEGEQPPASMDAEAEPDEPAADAETEYEEPAQAAETEPDEPPAVETESDEPASAEEEREPDTEPETERPAPSGENSGEDGEASEEKTTDMETAPEETISEPEKETESAEPEEGKSERRRRAGKARNVREVKSRSFARSFQAYKKKLMTHRARKWIRYGLIILGVLAAVLIVTAVIRNWRYTGYSVLLTDNEEDTVSSGYCSLDGNILKYSSGGAVLADKSNQTIWSASYSYTMQSPGVEICGSTAAIYDRNGTEICIFDAGGQIGAVSTEAPIVKIDVASQGVVAAILEDGENTWIQYYDQTGESISVIRTTIDSPGYPMDLGLSDDGTLMAVSYLCFENGQPKTRLFFYNFGSVGQNMMDNQVSSFEYDDILVPQVEYLGGSTCVAFREDGFTVFGGSQIPEERAEITVTQEIASTFSDSSHIGLVLKNEDGFQILVYDTAGREVLDQTTDFPYRFIEIANGQVILYNQTALCIYSLEGVEKYNGNLQQAVQQLFSIGQNRYVMITEEGLNIFKLG